MSAQPRIDEDIRCRRCGGLNPASAEWCGQCLARFSPAAEERPGRSQDPPREPELPEAPVGGAEGAFGVEDGVVTWRCAVCASTNPLEASTCGACGASFSATVDPPPSRPSRDPGVVALLSFLWPGVGHAYMGDWGQGVALAVMGAWVTCMALVFGVAIGPLAPLSVLFAATSIGLWWVAAHDAYRLAQGNVAALILHARALTWIFLGLVVLSLAAMVAAGFAALA